MSDLEVVGSKEKESESEEVFTPNLVGKTEVEKKAEELRNKVTLPKKPGARVLLKDMLEWLKLVPDESLETIMIYVYRLYPMTNKQLVDPNADNNIDVYSGETIRHLSEDLIIQTHGGGKYRFILADLNKKGKDRGEGFQADLSISIALHPPKLDLRSVMWDEPSNKGFRAWCRARNLIDEKNMPVDVTTEKTNVAASDASMVKAMELAMGFVEKMSSKDQQEIKRRMGVEDGLGKSIGDILLEKMKQEDPNKQIATMTALVGAMKGMVPEVKSSDNTIVASMMTMVTTMITTLVESSNKNAEMMMQFMKMSIDSNRGGKEDRDEFAKMKDLLEIAKEIKGGGQSRSTAEVIVDGATTLLAPALQLVNNVMTMNILKQGGKQPGAVPLTQTAPAGQPPQGSSPTAPQAIPAAPGQPGQPAIALPSGEEATAIVSNYAPLILKHLAHDGWEFGALVSDMFGDEIAAMIARVGPTELLAAAKRVPQFWEQVTSTYGEAHLDKWLHSLCNYREEARKAEEVEEAELEEPGPSNIPQVKELN